MTTSEITSKLREIETALCGDRLRHIEANSMAAALMLGALRSRLEAEASGKGRPRGPGWEKGEIPEATE